MNEPQVVVALTMAQADFLLNILGSYTREYEIARVIADQIEQSQADAIEEE